MLANETEIDCNYESSFFVVTWIRIASMTGRETVTVTASTIWIANENLVLNRSSRTANCPIRIPKAIPPGLQVMREVLVSEDSEDARACPL